MIQLFWAFPSLIITGRPNKNEDYKLGRTSGFVQSREAIPMPSYGHYSTNVLVCRCKFLHSFTLVVSFFLQLLYLLSSQLFSDKIFKPYKLSHYSRRPYIIAAGRLSITLVSFFNFTVPCCSQQDAWSAPTFVFLSGFITMTLRT